MNLNNSIEINYPDYFNPDALKTILVETDQEDSFDGYLIIEITFDDTTLKEIIDNKVFDLMMEPGNYPDNFRSRLLERFGSHCKLYFNGDDEFRTDIDDVQDFEYFGENELSCTTRVGLNKFISCFSPEELDEIILYIKGNPELCCIGSNVKHKIQPYEVTIKSKERSISKFFNNYEQCHEYINHEFNTSIGL